MSEQVEQMMKKDHEVWESLLVSQERYISRLEARRSKAETPNEKRSLSLRLRKQRQCRDFYRERLDMIEAGI